MENIIFNLVVVILVILFSMVLHEYMHGFIAYKLGDNTPKEEGRLTLNPLSHIDPFMTIALPATLVVLGLPVFGAAKPVPFNPDNLKGEEWGVALVALAGPFVNLFLAFMGYGVYLMLGLGSDAVVTHILQLFVSVNLGFFVFNMIPIPPLDGSRLLYALAPDFVRDFMQQIESMGIMIVAILVLVLGSQFSSVMNNAIILIYDIFNIIYSIFM